MKKDFEYFKDVYEKLNKEKDNLVILYEQFKKQIEDKLK